jgi:hypothetical protein
MSNRRQRWTSRVAFAAGVFLAAAVLLAGRVPAEGRPLDARASVAATASGGVSVAPERRVVASRRLAPGGPALRGRVRVLNQTSEGVSLLVRAAAPERALDQFVHVELRAGHARPLRTTLGGLRRWRRLGGTLASQAERRIAVRAWIPASVAGGHEGRRAEIGLEFTRKGASR